MSWNTSLRCTEQVRALFTGVRGIRILGSSDAGSCIEHPPSASSSDLLGNGEMLVMRTIERPADPLGELVGPQKPVELHDPPFPVYPLGLDGVQPRTLLRKKATHDPHPTAAVFDLPVVFSEPSPDLLGDVPARVVPDEHQHFLARRLELFGAPRKEPPRYTAHGPAVDEPQPHLAADLGQVEPVAGDRFGIGVVLGDRLLDHTMGLSPLGEAAEGRQGHPAPPALVLKAYGPLRVPVGHLHQSVASEASLFSFVEGVGGGDPSLGPLPERIPSTRERVARMVSPETRLSVSPSSKATSAAIESVHKLLRRPNSLGERWSNPRRASAPSSPKASRVRFGREDSAAKAARPRWLKSWMASRAVCEPHPKERAICGARSPLSLARMTWARRMTKASLERNAVSNCSFSVSDSERTNMGGLMVSTIASHTTPILDMH